MATTLLTWVLASLWASIYSVAVFPAIVRQETPGLLASLESPAHFHQTEPTGTPPHTLYTSSLRQGACVPRVSLPPLSLSLSLSLPLSLALSLSLSLSLSLPASPSSLTLCLSLARAHDSALLLEPPLPAFSTPRLLLSLSPSPPPPPTPWFSTRLFPTHLSSLLPSTSPVCPSPLVCPLSSGLSR